ncbi:MAG: peptidyl-alpha-hydroxyglycine alpha-amidating lyase family protein [Gemmatimonadota bacterium]|jgi:sugar lactone lactonase YvrE|nr:peptidyl-alpha-hydroxyglycine alpha-amidating lyase family protein [Gemmatimonadota bacterium]
MKGTLKALAFAAVFGAGTSVAAQAVPQLAFDAVDPLRFPNEIHLGEAAGVARNSRGEIFVYTRTGHPTINLGVSRAVSHGGSRLFRFSADGSYRGEIGQNAYGLLVASQVRVDPQDNIWIVDQLSGQVIKFDPEGRVSMVISRKPEAMRVPAAPPPANPGTGAGTAGESFQRPTDVAWDAAGNIYVADGYSGNSRIAKYDREGRWIKNWGTRGSEQGQFNSIRGIAIDARGQVYVADHDNNRIQVFDTDGNFIRQIGNVGAPSAICITPGSTQYLYVSDSNPQNDMEYVGGFIKLDLNGRVLGRFGSVGKHIGQFGSVNSIDCRDPNNLLVGELGNWRVQKVTFR